MGHIDLYIFFINNDAVFFTLNVVCIIYIHFKVYEYYDCCGEIVCVDCHGSYPKI